MKILVVGSGAREHALVWKLAGERFVRAVYCAPGNAGIGRLAHTVAIAADEAGVLTDWVAENAIDLVVVSDPVALAAGVVDRLRERELRVIGPSVAAMRLASDPTFADEVMQRHGVAMLEPWRADRSPDTILSVCVLADRQGVLPLPTVGTFYRLGAGGSGPLTEGIGAYAVPAPTPGWEEAVSTQVLQPLLEGIRAEGLGYSGVLGVDVALYEGRPSLMGLRLTLGDPQAQALLPCLQSELLPLLVAAGDDTVAEEREAVRWRPEACCAVVLVSGGYPEASFETGYGILGLNEVERGVSVFHGATRDPYAKATALVQEPEPRERLGGGFSILGFGRNRGQRVDRQARQVSGDPYGRIVTAGGRVLTVAALGATLAQARTAAYRNAARITFTDAYLRPDLATNA